MEENFSKGLPFPNNSSQAVMLRDFLRTKEPVMPERLENTDARLTNPEKDQDRVEDCVDHFKRFGYIMFPQQVAIYKHIAEWVRKTDYTVLEAGCGNGIGSAVIQRTLGVYNYLATDKLQTNIDFAKCLYPWMEFDVWDLNEPWHGDPHQVVVCVETFEHVADPEKAMANLVAAATEELIISTPNGRGKTRPPHNPYHVCEYTYDEMRNFIAGHKEVQEITVRRWRDWEVTTGAITDDDPLTYCLRL